MKGNAQRTPHHDQGAHSVCRLRSITASELPSAQYCGYLAKLESRILTLAECHYSKPDKHILMHYFIICPNFGDRHNGANVLEVPFDFQPARL